MTCPDRSADLSSVVYMILSAMEAFFQAFGLVFCNFNTAFRIVVVFFVHVVQYVGLVNNSLVPIRTHPDNPGQWCYSILSVSRLAAPHA